MNSYAFIEMMEEDIGRPAMFEQLAEECCELAHASLKVARVLREENPTPISIEEAERNFIEESADVDLIKTYMDLYMDYISMSNDESIKMYHDFTDVKLERWRHRLKEQNNKILKKEK